MTNVSPVKTLSAGRLATPSFLFLYVTALCGLALAGLELGLPKTSVWDVQDTGHLIKWTLKVVATVVATTISFIPIGAAAAYIMCSSRSKSRSSHTEMTVKNCGPPITRTSRALQIGYAVLQNVAKFVTRLSVSWLIALGICLLASRVDVRLTVLLLAPALVGCTMGVWVGSFWQIGRGARTLLAFQFMILVVFLAAGCVWLIHNTIAREPLDFQPPPVTSATKRELVARLKKAHESTPGQRRIQLAEDDVNLLLAWGLSLGSSNRKACVHFEEHQSEFKSSIGLPGRDSSFLNLRVSGQLSATNGQLSIDVHHFAVGKLVIPNIVMQPLMQLSLFVAAQDSDMRGVMQSLKSIHVDSTGIQVVVTSSDRDEISGKEVLGSLIARLSDEPEIVDTVRIHVAHLVRKSAEMPARGDERFKAFLQEAFRFAQQRSRKNDARVENRAAILALGILLGHPRVEDFVGPVVNKDMHAAARHAASHTTIFHRPDWSRHFMVSAAIALLSSDSLSNAAGLLKEELDADGGSGFSFGDLAADRAGTAFAIAATVSKTAATSMQHQITAGFSLSDLFPHATDFPEGINDAVLQVEYGGVGGMRYRQVISELEKRLGECKLLRVPIDP